MPCTLNILSSYSVSTYTEHNTEHYMYSARITHNINSIHPQSQCILIAYSTLYGIYEEHTGHYRGAYSGKSDCLVFYPKPSHFTENRQNPSCVWTKQ